MTVQTEDEKAFKRWDNSVPFFVGESDKLSWLACAALKNEIINALEEKISRYERYLACSYSHDQSIQGNAFFCNKCGYSKGELSLRAQH